MATLALKDSLDAGALAPAFLESSRLQIRDFLRHDVALGIFREMSEAKDWRLAVNRGETTQDYEEAELAGWPPEKVEALEREVVNAGRSGFQFRYDAIRVPLGPTTDHATPPMLRAFAAFLNAPETIDFMRRLTGIDDIDFADAHATRYRPGHFLTAHDDLNVQMGRRVAYVMNFTPQWRPDWGGLLQFYDERGNVTQGFTPAFNVLNLFKVPQPHSVSWVTPLAGAARYSITGWLRAGRPD